MAEEEMKVGQHVTVQLATEEHEAVEQVLDLQRYSKLKTVLRIKSWIKRFTDNTRNNKEKRRADSRGVASSRVLDQVNATPDLQSRCHSPECWESIEQGFKDQRVKAFPG